MSRYKGRTSSKAVERAFPHIVEITVPEGGLGKRLDAMYDWRGARGIEAYRGRGRREEVETSSAGALPTRKPLPTSPLRLAQCRDIGEDNCRTDDGSHLNFLRRYDHGANLSTCDLNVFQHWHIHYLPTCWGNEERYLALRALRIRTGAIFQEEAKTFTVDAGGIHFKVQPITGEKGAMVSCSGYFTICEHDLFADMFIQIN